jgi:hypothetical protein
VQAGGRVDGVEAAPRKRKQHLLAAAFQGRPCRSAPLSPDQSQSAPHLLQIRQRGLEDAALETVGRDLVGIGGGGLVRTDRHKGESPAALPSRCSSRPPAVPDPSKRRSVPRLKAAAAPTLPLPLLLLLATGRRRRRACPHQQTHAAAERTLVPCVRVTRVLPTVRTANMEGALTSYQSFLLKGSTAFFLPPFFPLLRVGRGCARGGGG